MVTISSVVAIAFPVLIAIIRSPAIPATILTNSYVLPISVSTPVITLVFVIVSVSIMTVSAPPFVVHILIEAPVRVIISQILLHWYLHRRRAPAAPLFLIRPRRDYLKTCG